GLHSQHPTRRNGGTEVVDEQEGDIGGRRAPRTGTARGHYPEVHRRDGHHWQGKGARGARGLGWTITRRPNTIRTFPRPISRKIAFRLTSPSSWMAMGDGPGSVVSPVSKAMRPG